MPLPVPAEFRGQTLTDNQRATWAKQAGFPADQIATAVAISIAENRSGKIDAIGGPNLVDGSYDYGMWQINDKAHPGLFERFPQWWSVQNANMTKAVWDDAGGSWRPWTTFTSGTYSAYMDRGRKAAEEAPWGGVGQSDPVTVFDTTSAITAAAEVLRGLANAVKSVAGGTFKVGAWMADPDNWQRVALVVAGGGLLIVGTTILLRPITKPLAQEAVKLAGPAAGGASAAKSAAKKAKG